mgnify:CR=1 FL=1
MKPLNEILEEIEGRVNDATSAPWSITWREQANHPVIHSVCKKHGKSLFYPASHYEDENSAFIMHAREDVPRLVKALRLAFEVLNQCKEDRHYYGSFKRHSETIKQIESIMNGEGE